MYVFSFSYLFSLLSVDELCFSSCLFTGEFGHPRPPEEIDKVVCEDQPLDTSVLDNDPATTNLLLQMFMSELQDTLPEGGDHVVNEKSPTPSPFPLDVVKTTVDTEVAEQGSPSLFAAVPSTSDTEPPSPLTALSSPLECTDFNCVNDPLDDPFLMEFTDISELLQESRYVNCSVSPNFSVVSSPASSLNVNDTNVDNEDQLFDLSDCSHFIPSFTNTTSHTHVDDLGIDFATMSDDALSMALSSPEEPLSVMLPQDDYQYPDSSGSDTDAEEQSQQTDKSTSTKSSCKRSASTDTSDEPSAKRVKNTTSAASSSKTSEQKYTNRRQKNNVASQVSRAKRRSRNKALTERVLELETHNSEMRAQEKELSAEIEKLKKMLVDRLAQ